MASSGAVAVRNIRKLLGVVGNRSCFRQSQWDNGSMAWLMGAQLASFAQAADGGGVAVWVGGVIVVGVFLALVWSVLKRNRLK